MKDQPAPDFNLIDQHDQPRSLQDFRGRWLVVYFYPKDGTPICTAEACSFRDEYSAIAQFGNAEIIGISQDSPESHRAFAEAHELPFILLSDEDLAATKAYGCYQPEDTPNRDYLGIWRSTFLIAPDGRIAKEYRGVVPEGHAQQIISDLQALQTA